MGPREYCLTSPKNCYEYCYYCFMHTFIRMGVSLNLEFGAPKLIKVKAHVRKYRDKVTKVRSHYRRVRRRA